MKSLKTNKVIFSVYRSNVSDTFNEKHHEYVRRILDGMDVSYAEVIGTYKGIKERSFLLQATNIEQHAAHLLNVLSLASHYSQESVLEVHNDDTAVLHYLDSNRSLKTIGKFQEISQSEAELLDAYTFEPISGRYFSAK